MNSCIKYLVFLTCGSIAYPLGALAQQSNTTTPFEGLLTYHLTTGDNQWLVEHWISGGNSRVDILMDDTRYQSILTVGGDTYLLDVLGKNIVAVQSMHPGPRGPEHLHEAPSPPPDLKKPNSRNKEPHFKEHAIIDSNGEGSAFGRSTLLFETQVNKRGLSLEGLPGYDPLPFSFFSQFQDFTGVDRVIAPTLFHYRLVPVLLHLEKRKGHESILKLVSIEERAVDASMFEIPSDYMMQMAPLPMGGPSGGSHGPGDRKGPPPGGPGGPH